MNILVSACLLGLKCKYDGNDNKSDELLKVISMCYNLIPVCPEQLAVFLHLENLLKLLTAES